MSAAAMLALTCASLNCIRGRGWFKHDRMICVGLMALAASLYAYAIGAVDQKAAFSLYVLLMGGLYLWAAPGWGNGFMAITGTDSRDYGENWLLCEYADRIIDVTQQTRLTAEQCHCWGLAYMSLRGLYILPLFAVLSLIFSPYALFPGLLLVLQGPAYFVMRWLPWREHAVEAAEIVTGAIIGLALAIAIAV